MEHRSKRLKTNRDAAGTNARGGSAKEDDDDFQVPFLEMALPQVDHSSSAAQISQISTGGQQTNTALAQRPPSVRRRADKRDDSSDTALAKLTVPQVPTVPPFPSYPPLTVPTAPSVTPLTLPTVPAYPFNTISSASSGAQVILSSSPPATPSPSSSEFPETSLPISLSTPTGPNVSTSNFSTVPGVFPSGAGNFTLSTTSLAGSRLSTTLNGTLTSSVTTASTLITSAIASSSSSESGGTALFPTSTQEGGQAGSSGGANGGSSPSSTTGGSGSAATSAASGGSNSSSSATTPEVVGSVVGGLAGLTLILVVLLFLIRRHKRRLNQRRAIPSSAGSQTGPTTERPGHTSLTSAVTPTFFSRWRQSDRPASSSEAAAGAAPAERGFQKLGGRKIEPVLQSGGDQYGGNFGAFEQPKDTEAASSMGDRGLSGSSFYRDSQGFYGGQGSAPTTPTTAPAPGPSSRGRTAGRISGSDRDEEIAVMRPSPARTPVTSGPAAVPSRLVQQQQPGQDGVGRSLPGQDGSRGSRFTESV